MKGKHAGPCPDAKTATKIAASAMKLHAKMNRACGGADRNRGIGLFAA